MTELQTILYDLLGVMLAHNQAVDMIPVIEPEHIGGVILRNTFAVVHEAHGYLFDPHALGVRAEELRHLHRFLNLDLFLLPGVC